MPNTAEIAGIHPDFGEGVCLLSLMEFADRGLIILACFTHDASVSLTQSRSYLVCHHVSIRLSNRWWESPWWVAPRLEISITHAAAQSGV
jgi:hypothetical protein